MKFRSRETEFNGKRMLLLAYADNILIFGDLNQSRKKYKIIN